MPRERKRRPDLDERFTLHPFTPDEVVRGLLEMHPKKGKPSSEDSEPEQEESEPTSEH